MAEQRLTAPFGPVRIARRLGVGLQRAASIAGLLARTRQRDPRPTRARIAGRAGHELLEAASRIGGASGFELGLGKSQRGVIGQRALRIALTKQDGALVGD